MPKHRASVKLSSAANVTAWQPDFPNPADLRFDYFRLLNDAIASSTGIGSAPSPAPSVAVIGAGVAGLTAARELFRAGYSVTIYEASERIAGRHDTRNLPGQLTSAELGAMRFPFFGGVNQPTNTNNCLLDYYLCAEAPGNLSTFPNPGTATGGTGIWVNQGYGPNDTYFPNVKLIPWWPQQNNGQPQNPQLEVIATKVNAYIDLWNTIIPPLYTGSNWEQVWESIAEWYDQMSFSDLVFTPSINASQYNNDGWLGGFGMNEEESELFYTIGSGDGSWGAFYEIGAMWFLRCVMFGFETELQTMVDMNNASSLPFYNANVNDSNSQPLSSPLYRGIQALDEWLYYVPPPRRNDSMHTASRVELLTRTTVDKIEKISGTQISVTSAATGSPPGTQQLTKQFDYVIVSPQIWPSQLSIELAGFDPNTELPTDVLTARDEQHLITSKKVFFALRKPYWSTNPNDNAIPQLIVTDTFVQDAYGVQWAPGDNGALLASYTWEDDATKLTPIDDSDLAAMVLAKLDEITSETMGQKISAFVDATVPPIVWRWSQVLGYSGCAKLYRQRNWNQSYDLLAYNQQYSAASRLYFAGESYDVTGGWTEPALRTAIDAVVHLIANSGGSFTGSFSPADYPQYDVGFSPNFQYPGGP